jgi:hypothetical protein
MLKYSFAGFWLGIPIQSCFHLLTLIMCMYNLQNPEKIETPLWLNSVRVPIYTHAYYMYLNNIDLQADRQGYRIIQRT